MKKIISLMFVALCVFSSAVIAHSGGTDSNGCHNNTKTGGYHCH